MTTQDTVWIVAAVVAAIIVIVGLVLIARSRRTQKRRVEANNLREEIAAETAMVDKRQALAAETEAKGARRRSRGRGQGRGGAKTSGTRVDAHRVGGSTQGGPRRAAQARRRARPRPRPRLGQARGRRGPPRHRRHRRPIRPSPRPTYHGAQARPPLGPPRVPRPSPSVARASVAPGGGGVRDDPVRDGARRLRLRTDLASTSLRPMRWRCSRAHHDHACTHSTREEGALLPWA